MSTSAITRALENTATEWGSSRWGEWQRCRRAHHIRYHLQMIPAPAGDDDDPDAPEGKPSYFDVGTLCHAVLRFVQEAPDALRAEWPEVLATASKLGSYDLGAVYEAERLMCAYWARYGLANAGWPIGAKILGVEVPLSTTLGSLPYTGRADAILQLPHGEIVVVDHKTRGRSIPKDRERYIRGLSVRPQFVGLSELVRRYLDTAAQPSVWVNAIVKTKIPSFDRLLVPIAKHTVMMWRDAQATQAWSMSRALDERDASGQAMAFGSCAPEGGMVCWAFQWCHGSQEAREKHFVKKEIECNT